MRRIFRDLAATLAVLIAVAGLLILMEPRVLERVGQVTGEVQSHGVSASASPLGNAARGILAVSSRSASDNPYLFSFAVVAAVLFMLMLRML